MHSQREPINVSIDKQLFLDDLFFASERGVVVPDEKAGHVKMYYKAHANQPVGPDELP